MSSFASRLAQTLRAIADSDLPDRERRADEAARKLRILEQRRGPRGPEIAARAAAERREWAEMMGIPVTRSLALEQRLLQRQGLELSSDLIPEDDYAA